MFPIRIAKKYVSRNVVARATMPKPIVITRYISIAISKQSPFRVLLFFSQYEVADEVSCVIGAYHRPYFRAKPPAFFVGLVYDSLWLVEVLV